MIKYLYYKIIDTICFYVEKYWLVLTFNEQYKHDKGVHSLKSSLSIRLSLLETEYNHVLQYDPQTNTFTKIKNYGIKRERKWD